MRALPRFSRQASKFTTLTSRRLLPVHQLSSLRIARSQYSTEASPSTSPQTQAKSRPHAPPAPRRPPQPEYEMSFTCRPCSTRSTHRVSKQGYHYGSVLITCPECKNRHVISDHLNIFGDKHMTIEDLMREQGQLVKKGTLSEDGNLEFWEDGSTTKRRKEKATQPPPTEEANNDVKGIE
ncbi:zf-DNL-domain-containing protein [Hyaloscypha hepaticicola]|uniref:Zf-DNL-domain-containing protein n=1 Tax=Hyaloscypha hepaticicola TaxID=2082293 RepID=A0A2J6PVM7_9HELO|nr:zf-DNL-domain-containing protein [Hyaloscypha hepaticicola]